MPKIPNNLKPYKNDRWLFYVVIALNASLLALFVLSKTKIIEGAC